MRFKISNDWHLGPRDDEHRIHPALVPYVELAEEDKKKDRDAVRNYPAIADRADHTIILEQ